MGAEAAALGLAQWSVASDRLAQFGLPNFLASFTALIVFLAISLIFRKSFCSWFCPIGTLSGAWWLDETLHWQDGAAVVLMMVAIASVLWPARTAPPAR